MSTNACPDAERLLAYLQGEAGADEEGLRRHAEVCPACAGRLGALRRLEDVIRSAPRVRTLGTCPPEAGFRSWLAGTATPEARASLEDHASRCGRCLEVLAAIHDEAAAGQVVLPEALRARLESLLPSTRRIPKARARHARLRRWAGAGGSPWAAALAAAGVLVAFLLFVVLNVPSEPRPVAEKPEPPATPVEPSPAPEERPRPVPPPPVLPRPEKAEPERKPPEAPPEEDLERFQREKDRIEEEMRLEIEKAQKRLRPEPAPRPAAPEVPTPDPQKPAVTSAAAVAQVERVEGEAFLSTVQGRVRAKAGDPLLAGQGVEVGERGLAVVVFTDDKTRMEVGSGSEVHDLRRQEAPGRGARGKRMRLARGSLVAQVPKQPPDQPLVFTTPQGEAKVLGTTLKLSVDPTGAGSTTLEVIEGKVRLTRPDAKYVDVSSRHYAVAAVGVELTVKELPKMLLSEDFESAAAASRRWRIMVEGMEASPILKDDRLHIGLENATGRRTFGEIRSRQAFALPLRISMEVQASHSHPDHLVGVSLIPIESEQKKDNTDALLLTMTGPRRAMSWGKGKWGWINLRQVPAAEQGVRTESWTLEVSTEEARFLRNGKEIMKQKLGGPVHPAYYLRLEGGAMATVPPGAYVQFDSVRVEQLQPGSSK